MFWEHSPLSITQHLDMDDQKVETHSHQAYSSIYLKLSLVGKITRIRFQACATAFRQTQQYAINYYSPDDFRGKKTPTTLMTIKTEIKE